MRIELELLTRNVVTVLVTILQAALPRIQVQDARGHTDIRNGLSTV